MVDWLIVTPAWGERCVSHFVNTVAPAIKIAAARTSGRVRFLVHTDAPRRIEPVLDGFDKILPPVPGGATVHHSLGGAHRHALATAQFGEAIAFINADMVPSIECFAAAERRFREGKRMIMTAGTRTLTAEVPPIGARSSDVLRWAWDHRHPWIVNCTWGEGRTNLPSLLHFRFRDNVVLHGFHLHPFAMLKTREVTFARDTIDHDLMEAFARDEIHVVNTPDELGFAEMSPRERDFGLRGSLIDIESIAAWARRSASPMHRWLFEHCITLVGTPRAEMDDAVVCGRILAKIGEVAAPARR